MDREEEIARVHRRGVIETRCDTWGAAVLMSCIFMPIPAALTSVPGALLIRRARRAAEQGQLEHAESEVARGKTLVLYGVGAMFVVQLLMLVAVVIYASSMPDQLVRMMRAP